MGRYSMMVVVAAGVLSWTAGALASIVIDTVTVGNPGNEPDRRYWSGGYGGVDYYYDIGKYEVTAGQYTAFLNAVAADDTYGLYNTEMWAAERGCKIERSGEPGSYTYSVAPDRANRPVNYVSWGDSARFTNWLNNGQPTGAQDLETTEDGSYYLNGAMSKEALASRARKADARWVLPSNDEWHKAAYHKNDGVTGNYYEYPTSSDEVPNNVMMDPDPGNTANFKLDGVYTLGAPYFCTEVGEFENSASPYGTFDQGGNLYEWNDMIDTFFDTRGNRGGAYTTWEHYLRAATVGDTTPEVEAAPIGFRVGFLPEPGSLALLVLGGAMLLRRRGLAR